jgi:peptide/nickel transport system substrate-binding protein
MLISTFALQSIIFTSHAVLAADLIRIVSPYRTTTLDPMRSASGGNIETYGQIYGRLLRRDADSGELQPGLAESWEISEDGRTYTFHLRDAQFSNGTPITADDVVFSLSRIHTDKKSAYPAPLSQMETITAKDPKTVVIVLKTASAPFLGNLEIWNMGVISKADVDARGEEKAFADMPVTSGPYTVKEWKPNDKIVLEPNPHYWRTGFPKSDAIVELREVTSPETRVAMLKAGEAEAVRVVQWAQIDDLKSAAGVDVRTEPSTSMVVALLNEKRELFQNLKARQAAAHAIDNKAMTKAITRGYGEPANTTLPKIDFHDDSYPGIAYDPALAKSLLAESGMAGREIKLLARPGTDDQQMALLLQAQWQAIGLKATIVNVDVAAWWEALGKGDYDAAAAAWYNETTDPDLAVRWSVCGTCGSNSYSTFYNNPKVDELVEQGARESDPAKRAEIYKDIQRISTEEVAQVPLYYAPNANAYSKSLHGLKLTPAIQWTLEDTTISK